MGKLIVIEGLDGSGKATQSKKLYDRLLNEKIKVKRFEFPNYKSESAWLAKEYLSGAFGNNFEEVDPKFASVCYAVDRLITYRNEIEKYYKDDYIIICDRWVTANMLHQACKVEDVNNVDNVLEFIEKLEYESFALPKPDLTIFLKVPYEYSYNVINERNKDDGSIKNDIHEKNIEFLKKSYENGIYVSNKYDWKVIECYDNTMKTIDEIHNMIYNKVIKIIK